MNTTTFVDSFTDRDAVRRLWNSSDETGTTFGELLDDIISTHDDEQQRHATSSGFPGYPAVEAELGVPSPLTPFAGRHDGYDLNTGHPSNFSTKLESCEQEPMDSQSDLKSWEEACRILHVALPGGLRNFSKQSQADSASVAYNSITAVVAPLDTFKSNPAPSLRSTCSPDFSQQNQIEEIKFCDQSPKPAAISEQNNTSSITQTPNSSSSVNTTEIVLNTAEPVPDTTEKQSKQSKRKRGKEKLKLVTENPTKNQLSVPTSNDVDGPASATSRAVHICDVCNLVFSSKCRLESHVSIHTGETPFVCTTCDKKFRLKPLLLKHFRRRIHIQNELKKMQESIKKE